MNTTQQIELARRLLDSIYIDSQTLGDDAAANLAASLRGFIADRRATAAAKDAAHPESIDATLAEIKSGFGIK